MACRVESSNFSDSDSDISFLDDYDGCVDTPSKNCGDGELPLVSDEGGKEPPNVVDTAVAVPGFIIPELIVTDVDSGESISISSVADGVEAISIAGPSGEKWSNDGMTTSGSSVVSSPPNDGALQDDHYEVSNGREFITVKHPLALKADQLNCSARFMHGDLEIMLYSESCLLAVGTDFVARVNLDDLEAVRRGSFHSAKEALVAQLRIVRVLEDGLIVQRSQARKELVNTLNKLKQTANSKQLSPDVMALLGVFLDVSKPPTYRGICQQMLTNAGISDHLAKQVSGLLLLEIKTARRNERLTQLGVQFSEDPAELTRKLRKCCADITGDHLRAFDGRVPQWLQDILGLVSFETIMTISEPDMKLFEDMNSVLNQDIFKKPLEDLGKRWAKMINSNDKLENISLTHPVYFFLCKSLEEVITEISRNAGLEPSDLLLSNECGWHPLETIAWRTESNVTKCLQREYNFLLKLIQHFDLATPGSRWPFRYQARFLLGHPSGIADELYVWYCLLDDALMNVEPNRCKLLVQCFMKLLKEATVGQMEAIRIIARGIIRLIVHAFPEHPTNEDKRALQMQINVIGQAVVASHGSELVAIFRDLLDVFCCYWKNRSEVIETIQIRFPLEEMHKMKSELLKIVLIALEKGEAPKHMVQLFRSFNDFLSSLNDCPLEWEIMPTAEVKMDYMVQLGLVEPIDNMWSGAPNQTFRVIHPLKFRQITKALYGDEGTVKHHAILQINSMLTLIHYQLNRFKWADSRDLSPADQLQSSRALVETIREVMLTSIRMSHGKFLEEAFTLFLGILRKFDSQEDFCKRVDQAKRNFWYSRELSSTNVETLFRQYLNNEVVDRALILRAYRQYLVQFNALVRATNLESGLESIAKAVNASVKVVSFKNWDAAFKLEHVPKILAGVTATWYLLASTHDSSTDKFFQPHLTQILCVLNLLSVDHVNTGIHNHMSQVPPGEGKPLILALTASVLALTGHNVMITCRRIQKDAIIQKLFQFFDIDIDITYENFASLPNHVISLHTDAEPVELGQRAANLLFHPERTPSKDLLVANTQNSVLLIDEADIFFSDEYYGNRYSPVATLEVAGLATLQEEIWRLVSAGNHDIAKVTREIQSLIASPELFPEAERFNQFYRERQILSILEYDSNRPLTDTYTNQELFDLHLQMMIADAIEVCKHPEISQKKPKHYVDSVSDVYFETFNYFRSIKTNFNPKEGNYGFLNVACGSISYATLLKDYSLVIGITSTPLNQHVKATIKNLHNIDQFSVMPSLFGRSNLRFDPLQNFHPLPNDLEWMNRIFVRASTTSAANRAVIVFFEDHPTLAKFHQEYAAQFHRLNVLTNSNANDLSTTAGITGTVTLATREMARDVDYQSSAMVEQNGGLHVIQSFFSLEGLEEEEIKRCTAWKVNKGSYELIVSREHLRRQGLEPMPTESVDFTVDRSKWITYASVDALRQKLALKKTKATVKSIRKGTDLHDATVTYLKSFFR